MKVHRRKANKDYPKFDIKKGDIYYAWQFRNQDEVKSKTYPKPQQLTQSDFLIRLYDESDRLTELSGREFEELSEVEGIDHDLQEIIDTLTELRDEQEEKKNNMPDHLQESATGELLQGRYDMLDEVINDLESHHGDLVTAINDDDIDRVKEVLEEIGYVTCGQ